MVSLIGMVSKCGAVDGAAQQIVAACIEGVAALMDVHGVFTQGQEKSAKVSAV